MIQTRARYRRLAARSIVPAGWVARQARQNLDGFLGALPDICSEVGGDVFGAGRLGPDSTAAGHNVADIGWWNGESEGNWLHAYTAHVRLAGDQSERRDVDHRLQRTLSPAGTSGGYLGMFTAAARAGRDWIPGDLWTRSRLLLALTDYAESNSSPDVWDAIDRCLDDVGGGYPATGAFSPGGSDTLVAGHDLQMIDPLTDAATRAADPDRATHLARLARRLYADFSRAPLSWAEMDGQLDVLASDEPFHGHGPHVTENLRIPLRLWELRSTNAELADNRLLSAYRHGWQKLQDCLGLTGACRSDETVGRMGARPWPVPEAGFEYCATTELALTALDHTRILGDPAGADLAETVWLNAAQAARVDAGGVGYFCAENQPAASRAQGVRWDVSPTHDDAAVCCAPNAGRILPAITDHAVLRSDRGLSVQQYVPSRTHTRIGGAPIDLVINTDFPFDDTVHLTVTGAPASFVLELRVPHWCGDPQVTAFPGAAITYSDRSITVAGAWPASAELRVELPRTVRRLRSIDGRTALAYGPLLLSCPIDAVGTRTRGYAASMLADRDFTPADPQELFPPYLTGPVGDGAEAKQSAPGDDPWGDPGLTVALPAVRANPQHASMQGTGVDRMSLVPIGSTILRWTCFGVLGPVPSGGTEPMSGR